MQNIYDYINSLTPISDKTKDALNNIFEKQIIDKNYFLVKNGQIANQLFFLEDGVIRTFFKNEDGSEYNKALDIPPTITCGYASIITGKPSKINLQTLTTCILWIADYSAFKKLYNEHPDLERAARIAAENSFVEKENRELEMALLGAAERYELFKNQFHHLEQLIPQYHIASYLGISATQLSRIRKGLKQGRNKFLYIGK